MEIQNINKICKQILKLTDKEFEEAISIDNEQRYYVHPLKLATQKRINEMGENNSRIISLIKELKDAIELNENLVKDKTKIKL